MTVELWKQRLSRLQKERREILEKLVKAKSEKKQLRAELASIRSEIKVVKSMIGFSNSEECPAKARLKQNYMTTWKCLAKQKEYLLLTELHAYACYNCKLTPEQRERASMFGKILGRKGK